MRRVPAVVLILIGLGLMAYPKARQCYYDYRRQQLLQAWKESRVEAAPEAAPNRAQQEREDVSPPPETEHRLSAAQERYIRENMIGVLRIPRIDLEMPVLKIDTAANLELSLAHVDRSAGPGAVGNFCLSGHRQLTYGRHFNRLHELSRDDLIEFEGPAETFTYRVFEIAVIQPEETGVLEPGGDEKLITLITCHGSRRPFTRFIARGRLVED